MSLSFAALFVMSPLIHFFPSSVCNCSSLFPLPLSFPLSFFFTLVLFPIQFSLSPLSRMCESSSLFPLPLFPVFLLFSSLIPLYSIFSCYVFTYSYSLSSMCGISYCYSFPLALTQFLPLYSSLLLHVTPCFYCLFFIKDVRIILLTSFSSSLFPLFCLYAFLFNCHLSYFFLFCFSSLFSKHKFSYLVHLLYFLFLTFYFISLPIVLFSTLVFCNHLLLLFFSISLMPRSESLSPNFRVYNITYLIQSFSFTSSSFRTQGSTFQSCSIMPTSFIYFFSTTFQGLSHSHFLIA